MEKKQGEVSDCGRKTPKNSSGKPPTLGTENPTPIRISAGVLDVKGEERHHNANLTTLK